MRILLMKIIFLIIPVLILNGCLLGDKNLDKRYPAAEISTAEKTHDSVCIALNNSSSYTVKMLFIYPRGTPPRDQWSLDEPDLPVINDRLCLSDRIFHFDEKIEYVIFVALTSEKPTHDGYIIGKRVVSAFEINAGQLINVELDKNEY